MMLHGAQFWYLNVVSSFTKVTLSLCGWWHYSCKRSPVLLDLISAHPGPPCCCSNPPPPCWKRRILKGFCTCGLTWGIDFRGLCDWISGRSNVTRLEILYIFFQGWIAAEVVHNQKRLVEHLQTDLHWVRGKLHSVNDMQISFNVPFWSISAYFVKVSTFF